MTESNANHDQSPSASEVNEEKVQKLARHYRHIGFTIFGTLAFLLAAFLFYSAISALQNNEAYDPYTNERVEMP